MNKNIKFIPEKTPTILFAEGCYGQQNAKIVTALVRYGEWDLVAGIDSTRVGKSSKEIIGFGKDIPIVANIQDALKFKPKAMIIGMAIQGGRLPQEWRDFIIEALENGMDVINGLHTLLNEDEEVVKRAKELGRTLWDVRVPVSEYDVPKVLPRPAKPKVILTVGSDCSIGKMFSSLEIAKELKNAKFLATGQTGILVNGDGIPLDRVIADFMAGASEELVIKNIDDKTDWLVIEGQGSLIHPSYSGITLALMHGARPDGMILCHSPNRNYLKHFKNIPIPPLDKLIEMYEAAMGFVKPAKVIGITLNCKDLTEKETLKAISEAEELTGLPVVDPVKTGVEKLCKKIEEVLG